MGKSVISTDIDKLINILKQKRELSLVQLSQESGLPISVLEQWLPILEEEGLIEIKYHLTKIYVKWLGETEEVEIKPEAGTGLPPEIEMGKVVPKIIKKPVSEKKEEVEGKKEVKEKEEKVVPPKEPEKKPPEAEEVSEKFAVKLPLRVEEYRELPPVKEVSVPTPKPVKKGVKPLKKVAEEVAGAVTESGKKPTRLERYTKKMEEIMGEINKTREELDRLKLEKQKLLREVYQPLEKRFETELNTLAEKIAEKEQQILELQKRAMAIPAMIEQVDRQQLEMQEIEKAVDSAFEETKITINDYLNVLAELERKTHEEMELAKEHISQGASHVAEMSALLNRINSIKSEISQQINEVEERIRQEQQRLNELQSSLKELDELETKASEKVALVNELIDKQKERLKQLDNELLKIGEVEEWVKLHQQRFEEVIKEFKEQIRANEEEYDKLREAMEANFVKRYLADLESMAKSYEFEFSQAEEHEKNIDERIEKAKQKLQELIEYSKEIVKAFEEGMENIEAKQPEEVIREVEEISGKGKELANEVLIEAEERKKIAQTVEQLGKGELEVEPEQVTPSKEKIEKPVAKTKAKPVKSKSAKSKQKPKSSKTKKSAKEKTKQKRPKKKKTGKKS